MILAPPQWRAALEQHRRRLEPWAGRRRRRASRGLKHPVEDFLFTYYRLSPAKLLAWHPGAGVALEPAPDLPAHLARPPYQAGPAGWRLEAEWMPPPARRQLGFIDRLLAATAGRRPRFACHGLHEWAMVDGLDPADVRHQGVPLRLPPRQLSEFLRSQRVECTHYDAFRFFTPSARPLNRCQPCLETRLELEQPGCVHANMDLYKWCYKLSPWIGGELLADAFELAVAARDLDMRASPYDLRAHGIEPIPIETEAGRRQYADSQQQIANQAQPIRLRLLEQVRIIRSRLDGVAAA